MCGGTGIYPRVNPYTIVKDENKSLADRAIIPLYDMNKIDRHKHNVYISLLKHYGYSLDTVYKDLPDNMKKAILYGTDGERFQLFDGDSMSSTDNLSRMMA